MRYLLIAVAGLSLSACATVAPRTGALSSYDGLTETPGALRAKAAARSDAAALAAVDRVRIAPARLADPDARWLSEAEQRVLLREIDAQLCFKMSRRYAIAPAEDVGAHAVRAVVAKVEPTGQASSVASAASAFFIPGPVGLRAPIGRGSLAAEAELLDPAGRQIAAIVWSRRATMVGTDSPSLSRIGDALQFVAPFAQAAARAMTRPGGKTDRPLEDPDPCAAFGPRFRPEGWVAKFATKLYVPQLSGASPDRPARQ